MTSEEFGAALKQFPCPECREAGHLRSQYLMFKIEHKGQLIEAKEKG